jgi:hypothetical protein
MVTREQARAIAQNYLNKIAGGDETELVLLLDATIERAFGWVFFYNSRRFVETGDPDSVMAGNAPFIVSATDGSIYDTGTAEPIENYIERFELYGSPYGPGPE